jgi:hypothetical protein
MGANAQTTVPSFSLGQVLTSNQMNQSARTGVPVFAGTAERDAAFGGTGEKTLAEGQLCYLESTNVVQYYDGSSWATLGPTPAPKIVQIVTGNTSTEATSATTTYVDTGLSATITPTSASNNILVVVSQQGGVKTSGNANNAINIRLVRNSTNIQTFAKSAGFTASTLSLYLATLSTQYLDSPGTTSATTYKTQFANDTTATGVRLQDAGNTQSWITLYEVTP